MGCFYSNFNDPAIQVYDCILPGDKFDYLRPHGSITITVDRKYNIPVVNITFDGCNKQSCCLWPKHSENENIF